MDGFVRIGQSGELGKAGNCLDLGSSGRVIGGLEGLNVIFSVPLSPYPSAHTLSPVP